LRSAYRAVVIGLCDSSYPMFVSQFADNSSDADSLETIRKNLFLDQRIHSLYAEIMKRLKIDKLKREVIQGLLPAKLAKTRRPFFLKKDHPHHRKVSRCLRAANIVGLGIGAKESDGRIGAEMAVCVFVTHKVKRGMNEKYRVPTEIGGMKTDVVPVGRLVHHVRPTPLGGGVSRAGGGRGTLGVLVKCDGSSKTFFVTAAHVIAPDGDAAKGDVIVEPPYGEGGSLPFGKLEEWEPLDFDGGVNEMDAALGSLDNPADALTFPASIGRLAVPPMDPFVYQSVRKNGAKTNHTLGVVTHLNVDISIFTAGGELLKYNNAFAILGAGGPFSEGGDSGALIVDAVTKTPVGLLIGGETDGPRTFAIPIARILTRFNARIVI
jgi:hypothetical protein